MRGMAGFEVEPNLAPVYHCLNTTQTVVASSTANSCAPQGLSCTVLEFGCKTSGARALISSWISKILSVSIASSGRSNAANSAHHVRIVNVGSVGDAPDGRKPGDPIARYAHATWIESTKAGLDVEQFIVSLGIRDADADE